ncbi:hypothetical protein [Microbispora sp. GKU 823]|uniref:hypothetical protein n=1 Tax=Microbispora sp. GKU 823 TaxID=1652100 RepID=UPI001C4E0C3A|nr:hypothetical protein [Microbispora sp. GKU 823]
MEPSDADAYFGREELSTCRKFGPAARNYTACRLMADVGLRVNEACKLDLADITGTSAVSASSTSVTARAPAAQGRANGWSH